MAVQALEETAIVGIRAPTQTVHAKRRVEELKGPIRKPMQVDEFPAHVDTCPSPAAARFTERPFRHIGRSDIEARLGKRDCACADTAAEVEDTTARGALFEQLDQKVDLPVDVRSPRLFRDDPEVVREVASEPRRSLTSARLPYHALSALG